ncbi:MAG: hypothetical protein AAGF76_08755 [Pseudomonadota bacterium]
MASAVLLLLVAFFPARFEVIVEALATAEVRERLEDPDRGGVEAVLDQAREAPLSTALTVAGWRDGLDARRHAVEAMLEELPQPAANEPCVCPILQRLGVATSLHRTAMAIERLEASAEAVWAMVVSELRRDVAIFSASTLGALLLAAGIGRCRPASPLARRMLAPLSITLSLAACAMAALYLGGQDWAETIVFGSYWGTGYTVGIGIAWLLLADMACTGGNLICQPVMSAVGTALNLIAPC